MSHYLVKKWWARREQRLCPPYESAELFQHLSHAAHAGDLPDVPIFCFRRDDERRHVKKSTARRARFGVIGAVESHSKKFYCSAPTQITSITTAVSSHTRGVSRSSRTRDEMRWTQQRQACDAKRRADCSP